MKEPANFNADGKEIIKNKLDEYYTSTVNQI
jgi:hypothetical protein